MILMRFYRCIAIYYGSLKIQRNKAKLVLLGRKKNGMKTENRDEATKEQQGIHPYTRNLYR